MGGWPGGLPFTWTGQPGILKWRCRVMHHLHDTAVLEGLVVVQFHGVEDGAGWDTRLADGAHGGSQRLGVDALEDEAAGGSFLEEGIGRHRGGLPHLAARAKCGRLSNAHPYSYLQGFR
jgi:hypothetical protein